MHIELLETKDACLVVPVTVYVVEADGDAITFEPVVALSPVAGDQL
jgi:hypothetical protein